MLRPKYLSEVYDITLACIFVHLPENEEVFFVTF